MDYRDREEIMHKLIDKCTESFIEQDPKRLRTFSDLTYQIAEKFYNETLFDMTKFEESRFYLSVMELYNPNSLHRERGIQETKKY